MEFLGAAASFGASGEVELIETHISAVFLVGDRACKLKKAVHLPYLDFSTPEIRLAACETELDLNRAVTPELYLGIRRITREPGGLTFDGPGELVDAVVEMVRFDQEDLLDRVASRGELSVAMIRTLAREIAAAHEHAPVARGEGGAANIAGVLDINRAGFGQSRVFDPGEIEAIDAAFRAAHAGLAPLLDARARDGRIRRCHGDLHLRNICLFQSRPRLFDCLDFSDQLATIDVLYDLAFLAMDLWYRGLPGLSNLLVNAYLDITGQEDGFALLPFFMALRAEVRAHVIATQVESCSPEEADERRARARAYYDLALSILEDRPAGLVALGGLSGSGKSTLAAALAPKLGAPPGARLIESDLVRKAMFGVEAGTRLPEDAYKPEVSKRVYATLARRARALLEAGCQVVADAVYDRPDRRAGIGNAAAAAGVPFTGIWLEAAPEVLMRRVAERHGDVSDATIEVLQMQLKRDPGQIDWLRVSTAGTPEETLDAIRERLWTNRRRAI